MLTSLIIAYFLLHGGASYAFAAQLSQISDRIKKGIPVEATRKQALALVDSADQANKTFVAKRKSTLESLDKLLGDRTSTSAQLDSALHPVLTADSTTAQTMIDLVFKLKPVIGASDWAKVFPPPSAAATNPSN